LTVLKSDIENSLQSFEGISLGHVKRGRLLRRVEVKYLLRADELPRLLTYLQGYYQVLQIGHERVLPYQTWYYDTPGFHFYRQHQRGKINRQKVRVRYYQATDDYYVEVKMKTKPRYIEKERMKNPGMELGTKLTGRFVKERTSIPADEMDIQIANRFFRVSFYNKTMDERLTIDSEISFTGNEKNFGLPGLAVVEVKQDKSIKASPVTQALRDMQLRPSAFSKYCTGLSLSHPELKSNNFKPIFISLKKLLKQDLNDIF
jgi:hypothetical protein